MTRQDRDATESGVLVYPRMPVPKPRDQDPSRKPPRRSSVNKVLLGIVGGALLGGVVIGMVLRPIVAPDARIGEARRQAEEAGSAAAAQETRADGLAQELDAANAKQREIAQRLEVASRAERELADAAAEEQQRAKALEAARKQLVAGLRGAASVTADGDDLRITINSGALFTREDVLSARGKQIVERVGGALKELLDRQVAVHGHTDDTPLPLPKPPPAPAPPKKGARPAPAPAPAPPRFATNWELSAGRAVAVVRHLQEASKLDPGRLSAAGHGQYRPASRRDKAANRRIEIVLSPKPKPKSKPKSKSK